MKIYTNSETIDELIEKRCLVDRELGLCDAFIDGVLMEEVPGKGEVRSDLMSVADMCDAVEEKQTVESMMALMTKVAKPFDTCLTTKARQEEMRGFEERQIYHHVLRSVVTEGRFIGVRWVAVNKGTKEVPKVRSRLVGQEFAHGEQRDDLYTPTPPLAVVRVEESEAQVTIANFPGTCTLNYLQKILCLRESTWLENWMWLCTAREMLQLSGRRNWKEQ